MFKFHQKYHNRNFMILTLLERWFDMDLLLDSQDNKEYYLRSQVQPLTQLIAEVPSIFLWPLLEHIGLKPIMNTVVLAYSIPSGNYTFVFLWRTHTSPTLSTFGSRSSTPWTTVIGSRRTWVKPDQLDSVLEPLGERGSLPPGIVVLWGCEIGAVLAILFL